MNSNTTPVDLLIKLYKLQARLHKRIDRPLSAHGINFTDFMVLYHLGQAPDRSMRRVDLADQIGLTASGVTRLLLPLEKIGLVQRETDARDARVSLVKLTRTGANVLDEATLSLRHSAEDLTSALSDTQLAKFTAFVEALT